MMTVLYACLTAIFFAFPHHQEAFPPLIDEIFTETNKYRRENNLDTLELDKTLSSLAAAHSKEMASGKEKFGHGGFEKRFEIAKKKLSSGAFAENVYKSGTGNGKEAVEAWIGSEGHRRNMVGTIYKRIGIGIAKSENGNFYYTQIFSD